MRIKKLLSRKQKKLKEELIEYEIEKIGRQLAGEMIKNYDPEWPDPGLTKKEKELLAARYEVTQALSDEKRIRRYKKRDFLFFKYWPSVYQKGCKKPIDEKLVLFVNDHYDTLPDNMQGIYEKLSQMGYTCELLLKPKAPDQRAWKTVRVFFVLSQIHKSDMPVPSLHFLPNILCPYMRTSPAREPIPFSFGTRAARLKSSAIPLPTPLGE